MTHISAKPEKKLVSPELLKTLVKRSNDVLLISCILVLGMTVLTAIHTMKVLEKQFAEQARV